ncbi:MAG: hypothetical protein COZ31_06770 [Nitrospirae bacterium CG_4_10_14_3_um_filter_44_29]|nr:helix-turn-helix transcriptional regulator [Nitrospirota bacterium]OIO29998.1 MAG: hypothetical protein AUJ60_03605 [Nitrospirae bacterium CG1_02_44_142]PIV65600.1 MAG: hypothetical protein COS10_10515 [Nitrospirae bacterium CG01_land_8_20_14_3_00_44_22]PIX88310.1 MAG: hypothetical protein COZ31_06770 [Nitrospirae bacterium CG_4_10_14_3_um_filter_44_29]PJA81627.1 MAG: hypothetical protein CO147_08975 [Nitrospirae bacterium CG_4_9_14_3_um_filter_44_28]
MNRDTDKRHIGSLIRIVRKAAGLSQMALAERVGISYQQIQKYEKGVSEISVSRLPQIARALNIPLSRFVLDEGRMMISEAVSPYGALSDNEIELLKFFRRIKDKKLKDGFLIAIKSIAELSGKRDKKG